jgi:hypothetical protein
LGEGLLWHDEELLEVYCAALAEAGDDPSAARVSGLANMVVVDDPEAAWPRIAPHLSYQWTSYAAHSADDAALELKQRPEHTLAGEAVDPESLRSPGPAMNPPAFDVVTPADAIVRLRRWLTPLPVEHVYFWASIAGITDDLVERHIELLATEVAPQVADLSASGEPVKADDG